ncbi:MAG: phosphoribosylformylglycinamidine synthase I [Candidatus Latescibacterota bacterium]|nr:MAG: phosphoribosylformylglycinamidine synthase I [Candidatus Latescibacterota bacterium]
MSRIAVVEFPGTNCMVETAEAVRATGARAEVVLWNASFASSRGFDGYVIAGGFAYEDRVRAGAIAAKHAILDAIAEAAAAGRPVLGVCNGAQVLVEAGLVPGIEPGSVQVALARNASEGWRGYYCEWVHLRADARRGFLHALSARGVLPMPVGHGEGRFTGDPEFFAELDRRGQVALRYVRPDGGEALGFPDNPNGSLRDAAALCDPSGCVVAMMPHPERAAWLFQVPLALSGAWGARRRQAADDAARLRGAGPGLALYAAMVHAASTAEVG